MTQIALTSPAAVTILLERGKIFTATPGISSYLTVAVPAESVAAAVSAATDFGPYLADREVTLNLILGTVVYEVNDSAGGAVSARSIVTAIDDATPAELADIQSSVSGAPSAQCQGLLRQLDTPNRHVSILVHGDSTGNELGEWPHRLAQWLAAKYTAFTVRWRAWNTAGDVYDAPVIIQTGTGTYNIDIWCASNSGKKPSYLMGGRFLKSTLQITDTATYADVSPVVDLFILNHGKNIATSYLPTEDIKLIGLYQECVEVVLLTHSQAGVIIIGQGPNQNKSDINAYRSARAYATSRGFGFADVWSLFAKYNYASNLYGDGVHPSVGVGTDIQPTGTDLWLRAVTEHFQPLTAVSGPSNVSSLSTLGYNLARNGLFKTWTNPAAAPDGWTASAGVSCGKDTSGIVDSENGYCLKMTSLGNGTPPMIEQYFPASALAFAKGRRLTLGVRMYQPAGETSGTNGRINLYCGAGAGAGLYSADLPNTGGWIWRFISVDGQLAASYGRIQVYLDTLAATPAGAVLYVDQIVLVVGPVPRAAIQ